MQGCTCAVVFFFLLLLCTFFAKTLTQVHFKCCNYSFFSLTSREGPIGLCCKNKWLVCVLIYIFFNFKWQIFQRCIVFGFKAHAINATIMVQALDMDNLATPKQEPLGRAALCTVLFWWGKGESWALRPQRCVTTIKVPAEKKWKLMWSSISWLRRQQFKRM